MSDALARVFALQQHEINRKRQAQLQHEAKEERERQALISTSAFRMLQELAELQLKRGVDVYNPTNGPAKFKHLLGYECEAVLAGKRKEFRLRDGSSSNEIRFYTRERESGVIDYCVKNGVLYEEHKPDNYFITILLEFAARVIDPAEVEKALTAAPQISADNSRRRLQAV